MKLLVDVSDLHCGSDVGLSPRQFTLRSGNTISIGNNLCQEWLALQWDIMVEKVAAIVGKDPFALLVNGDATEGVHHRNNKDLIAAEIDKHVEMAETMLRPLHRRAKKTFIVKGTECHTADMETLLAERLKAETKTAKDKWLIRMHGCLIDAAHHMGTTSRAYLEASAMSIHMGNARQNYLRCGHEVPKVFLRGHRHCGGWFCDGGGIFGVTGAWQFLTRHGHKVVTDSIPQPTALVLDWRQKEFGELPDVIQIKATPAQSRIYNA